jgi:hypothetical protein
MPLNKIEMQRGTLCLSASRTGTAQMGLELFCRVYSAGHGGRAEHSSAGRNGSSQGCVSGALGCTGGVTVYRAYCKVPRFVGGAGGGVGSGSLDAERRV